MATRSDRGQAALVVLVTATVVLAGMTAGLVELGHASRARVQAQTAADAAALASLDGGRAAAVSLAGANGAVLLSWVAGPGVDEVTVTVEVDGVRATARATDSP